MFDENGEPKFTFLSSVDSDGNMVFTEKEGTEPSFLSIKKPQIQEDTKINEKNDGVITEDGKYIVEDPSQVKLTIDETFPTLLDPPEKSSLTFDLKTLTSNLDQTLQFKEAQITFLKQVLQETEKQIRQQEQNINKQEARKEFKKLYKLQKEVSDRLQEIQNELKNLQDNRNMEAVVEMAENSFKRLDHLLNKENPNSKDLLEANGIVQFYKKMQIIPDSQIEHPLFPTDFILTPDGKINNNNISTELENYLGKLTIEANKKDGELKYKKTRISSKNSK